MIGMSSEIANGAHERRVVLLGPQREHPAVHDAVAELAPEGRVATVTAGWEEREAEDQELIDHLGRETLNLALYPRTEHVFEEDPELFRAMHERNDRLRRERELYAMRLGPTLGVARDLLARSALGGGPADDRPLEREIEGALEAVRALDEHHLANVREQHAEFEERWTPLERDAVARHRSELAAGLADCGVLCIAGGHVGILLDRLRLFDVLSLVPGMPVVAWSGGGMVVADRVVLFHDSPPQGAGDAEVFRYGLGVAPGLVPLPWATSRLRLDDPLRVGLFARRFAPRACPTLDPGARLDWDGSRWHGAVPCLAPDGATVPLGELEGRESVGVSL